MTGQKTYKIVIVGDANVGKSTYVKILLEGKFQEKYIPTMGCDVSCIVDPNVPLFLEEPDQSADVFNLWDCAGDEKYSGLGESYYKKADGAIVMYSEDSKSSYDNVIKWIEKLEKAGISNIVICGNKIDKILPKKQRVKVNPEDFRDCVREYPIIPLSSKGRYNFALPLKTLKENM